LGRLYYEPIKDRHGNILIVTIREVEMLYSFFNGKWMQISKLQSQRKSLSTPEEPTALDILLITIQVCRILFSNLLIFVIPIHLCHLQYNTPRVIPINGDAVEPCGESPFRFHTQE